MSRRRRARLEMTPLMDVMFLVLVVFIYAIFSMTASKGVKVDLPGGKGESAPRDAVVVTVKRGDTFQLNGEDMERGELLRRLSALDKAGLPIVVSADKAASMGAGVELLASLKALGAEKVTIRVSGEERE